jgi:Zn-dependent protease
MRLQFSPRELRDLLVAWLALGLAFTFFFERVGPARLFSGAITGLAGPFFVSLVTVGVGFLLHELAHKVVAIRFGRPAEFRADMAMLALAIGGGLAGFIFAAPGAVYHRGAPNPRENGLIALAGPVTNLVLAVVFLPFVVFVPRIGVMGVSINLLLAGFNMLPIGGLDGATVRRWNLGVYLAVALPSFALGVGALFFI